MNETTLKVQGIAGGKVQLVQSGMKFDPRFQVIGEYRGQRFPGSVCRKQEAADKELASMIERFAVIEASREKTIEDEHVTREYGYVSIDEEALDVIDERGRLVRRLSMPAHECDRSGGGSTPNLEEMEKDFIEELFPEISKLIALSAEIQRKRVKKEAAERKAAEHAAKILAEIEHEERVAQLEAMEAYRA
jgi:hypothetical protein